MRSKRGRSREKKSKRGIYLLPNLLTSASLFGGFYAIIAAIHGRPEAAATAILVSAALGLSFASLVGWPHPAWATGLALVHGLILGLAWDEIEQPEGLHLGVRVE